MSSNDIDTRFMTKVFITKFIEIYEQHPALWKTTDKKVYLNKNLKDRGYDALVSFCKLTYPEADKQFVKKKIQNLRGCFRKELKKVENSKRSGSGTDEIYVPQLWYFEMLLFTKNLEMPVESSESEEFSGLSQNVEPLDINETDEWQEEKEEEESNSQNGSKTPVLQAREKNVTSAKKRKLLFQQQQQEFMTVCADVLKQKDTIEEYDALGISVSAKMKKMNPMQQILAEALINKILVKGIFNEITKSTDVIETNIYPSWYQTGIEQNCATTLTVSPVQHDDVARDIT